MNPMIAALQTSRAAGPVAPAAAGSTPLPEAAGPGDAMLKKLAGIEAKIDKICAAMNLAGESGHEPGEIDGTEAPPNDDGN